MKRPNYAFSRVMYIIEVALEYFISMMIGGAYLAKIAGEIGLSDSTTGVLTSFVSLGLGFQIFALFLRNKTPVKCWVSILHIVNQCFFALVWLTPLFPLSGTGKTVLFIGFLLIGHVLCNVITPSKVNWLMSLVDDRKRGVFTANKEIVSLISGMIFSYVMGALYDFFEAKGETVPALIIGGITIFGLMILHTVTLLLSDEKPTPKSEKTSLRTLFSDRRQVKSIFLVIGVNVLWAVAHYITTPFYGTYQVKELGFSMTFVSVLGILYAVARSAVSRLLGKFADRHSFASMLNICFVVVAVAFGVNVFTVPENGKVFFTIYYVLFAVAMAGINSSAINLIYDYVEPQKRTVALAFSQSISGIVGFLATYFAGFLVEWIQENGLVVFGRNIYAQQVMSLLGVVCVLIALLYTNLAVRKLPKKSA